MCFGGFEGTRLKRLLKKSVSAGVLKGRTFRCAVKLFIFVITSGLQPARNLLFRRFQQPPKALLSLPLRDRPLRAGPAAVRSIGSFPRSTRPAVGLRAFPPGSLPTTNPNPCPHLSWK